MKMALRKNWQERGEIFGSFGSFSSFGTYGFYVYLPYLKKSKPKSTNYKKKQVELFLVCT